MTNRTKLKKYFPAESVDELINFLETIALKVEIAPIYLTSSDPKDNFLLDLIHFSKADYLVTGDKDLPELNPFKGTKILLPSEFEKELEKQI